MKIIMKMMIVITLYKSNDKTFHYHILNDDSLNESSNNLTRIIKKELEV